MIYDPELWPNVSNLVVWEMVKRAWSLFKIYFNYVCLVLGRRANFYDLEVDRPTRVDDTVLSKLQGYFLSAFSILALMQHR